MPWAGSSGCVIIAFKMSSFVPFWGHPREAQESPEGNLTSDFFSSRCKGCFYCNVL